MEQRAVSEILVYRISLKAAWVKQVDQTLRQTGFLEGVGWPSWILFISKFLCHLPGAASSTAKSLPL